ncbi:MAG: S8 family serine peptidase [Candidatus Aminicenantales bacterium]
MIKRPVIGILVLLLFGVSLPSAAQVTGMTEQKLDRIFAEGKDAFYTTIGTIIDRHFMKPELDGADLARLLNARHEIPYLFERLMIFAYQKDAPLYEEWARKGDEESLGRFREKFLGLSQDYAARFVGSLFRKTRLYEFETALPHNKGKGRLDLVLQSIGFNARNDLPDIPREKWFSNPIKQDLTAQWAVDAVRARECWPRTKGSGVVVAVLDSGVDPYNTLFKDRLVPGFNFLKRTQAPWRDEDVPAIDYGLHGTGVSSVLLAIAPECRIMPVRVMDSDTMNDPVFDYWMHEFEAAGIYYAVHHGAQVISISAALHASQPVVAEAVRYAYKQNALICSSAGNISRSQFGLNPDDAFYRAFDSEVILIGGVERQGTAYRPWLYTLPNPLVDAAAPSAEIFVLVPSYISEVKDDYVAGTSLAAPIAAGIVALLRSAVPPSAELLAKPAAYCRLVSRCLRETARLDALDVVEPNDVVGRGLLDAAAAIAMMERLVSPEH